MTTKNAILNSTYKKLPPVCTVCGGTGCVPVYDGNKFITWEHCTACNRTGRIKETKV